MPKHLVVSAVNLREGGPLTVLLESLDVAAQTLPANWKITVLVHRKELIENKRIIAIEFPQSKGSWFTRLRLEWFEFNRLSQILKPDLWLSLHDITPRVRARRQVVYCHNPSPFYRLSWRDARLEPTFALFNLLYGRLYGIFIARNHAVVVQQEWLRTAFRRIYSHPNVVVAYPTPVEGVESGATGEVRLPSASRPLVLLYPALPRVFKNFEVLCEAMALLPLESRIFLEVRLTLSGSENAYAKDIYKQYSKVPGIKFIGRQSRQQMEHQYRHCDVVLFPSKLETWGLPISEAKAYGKPLLVADLPYAHETVGTCGAVAFLPAQDAHAWAEAFKQIASGRCPFEPTSGRVPDSPFAANWSQLWHMLTSGL